MSKKKYSILILIFIAFLVLLLFFFNSRESALIVHLDTYTPITSDSDSDRDGVPDWLEEIAGSDYQNATSFPYERDIARAKNLDVNDLLYGGPGAFTEEIVRKLLIDDGTTNTSTITPEERTKFISISTKYFVERAQQKDLPVVVLSIDSTVSREEILDQFLISLRRFSDEKQSITGLIFELFGKNVSIIPTAQRTRAACEYTLQNIPRGVPEDVYVPYFLILERITYLCEALTIALTADTVENFFYVLRLNFSGRLFEDTEAILANEVTSIFINAIEEVVELLEK